MTISSCQLVIHDRFSFNLPPINATRDRIRTQVGFTFEGELLTPQAFTSCILVVVEKNSLSLFIVKFAIITHICNFSTLWNISKRQNKREWNKTNGHKNFFQRNRIQRNLSFFFFFFCYNLNQSYSKFTVFSSSSETIRHIGARSRN